MNEKTNQCAETCERAKLCAVCGVSLNQEQGAVAWMYTNAQGKTVIVESDVPPYDDAVPLLKSEPQPEQSVMCDNDIEHFYTYAKEFTLPVTLKGLIESHKRLRQKNRIKHDEWVKELSAATELGRKQGLEIVTEHEFVSIEELKSMTINELVLFLYDGRKND